MKCVLSAALAAAVSASAAKDPVLKGPVLKVVTLLTELKGRLESDNVAEQQTYDKYACWCEKTTQRKAAAITAGREQLRALSQEILARKSTVAEKTLEIQETLTDVQENQEAQKQATSIRQKENAAYMTEAKEMTEAINALERAILVLKAASSMDATTLLQEHAPKVRSALVEVQTTLADAPLSVLTKLDDSRLQALSKFSTSLLQKAEYTPQSMTIQGILQDLYATMAQDLESMHHTEAKKSVDFESFLAVKHEQMATLKEKLDKAEEVKVESETMLAEALQSYGDTEDEVKDDVTFFDATKDACTTKAEDWSSRKSLRSEELAGITKALAILTSEEAKGIFGKTIKPGVGKPGVSFLQVVNKVVGSPVSKAVQVLQAQATKAHSLRLAAVVSQVQLAEGGHFDEVIKSIDTLIQVVQQEGADDITFRDNCRSQLHDIESKVEDLNWKVEVNDAKLDKIGKDITELEALQTQTGEDIKTVTTQIADLTSNRTQDNADYLSTKGDNEKAIELLEKAKTELSAYYANHSIEMGPTESGRAFLQRKNETGSLYTEDDAPDAKFSGKGTRKNESKGIVAILETIIEDLTTASANAIKEEEAAQLAYEAQKKAAEDLKEALETKLANVQNDLARRKEDETEEETKKTTNQDSLKDQDTEKQAIKPNCDSAASLFNDRQQKREAELDGLQRAREFLAGYQVSSGTGSDAPSALVQAQRGAALTVSVRRHAQMGGPPAATSA